MRPRISITGSVRPSVRPSVGPSVRWSVRRWVGHAFVKNKENQYFWVNSWQSKYTRLIRSIMSIFMIWSIRSVSPAISLSSFCKYEYQQIEARVSEEYHRIKSTYNHSIIMRTHRWPYGPCCVFIQLSPLVVSESVNHFTINDGGDTKKKLVQLKFWDFVKGDIFWLGPCALILTYSRARP